MLKYDWRLIPKAAQKTVGKYLSLGLFSLLIVAPAVYGKVYLSDLSGLWKNNAGDLIRISLNEQGALRGVLVEVSAGSQQLGYQRGQLIIKDVTTAGDNEISLKYLSTDFNPIYAQRCQKIFTDYSGVYSVANDGKVKILGEGKEVAFDLPWNEGEPCVIRYDDQPFVSDLSKLPERRFALRDLRVEGVFHCQHPEFQPPHVPYSDVTIDGHFRMFLPPRLFPKKPNTKNEYDRVENLVTASVYKKDPTDNSWVSLGKSPVSLAKCKQPKFAEGIGSTPPGASEGNLETPNSPLGLEVKPSGTTFISAGQVPGQSAKFAMIDPKSDAFPVHLDEVISLGEEKDFWTLLNNGHRDRKFQITVSAKGNDGAINFGTFTPIFAKDEIYLALESRLNDLTRKYFGQSLKGFDKTYLKTDDGENVTDYTAIKPRFWQGFFNTATELFAELVVENRHTSNTPHTVTLKLFATFDGAAPVELERQNVELGAGEGDLTATAIQLLSSDKVLFSVQNLLTSKTINSKNLSKLTGIEVKAEPAWAGEGGISSVSQRLNQQQLKQFQQFVALAEELNTMGNQRGWLPYDKRTVSAVGTSLSKLRGQKRRNAIDARESLRVFFQHEYENFVRLHKTYTAFKLSATGTVLDELDRYVRRYWKSGQLALEFDDPNKFPAWTVHGASDPAKTVRRFELSQSGSNVALSFVSATLNPQLSFNMDPTLFPLLADGKGHNNSPVSSKVQGVTNWVFHGNNRMLDGDMTAEKIRTHPHIRESYRRLNGGRSGHQHLGGELQQKVKTGELSSVRGQLFEDIMIPDALSARAKGLEKLLDGSSKKVFDHVVVIEGHQIYGGSNKEEKLKAGLLTDGMVIGKTPDGQWHILAIAEAKSGAHGANDIFGQFRKDVRRMLHVDLQLSGLDKAQQKKLGITSDSFIFKPVGQAGGLKANFSNDYLYLPFVVQDADIQLPKANADEGPGVKAIRRAMGRNVVRSPMSTEDTHLMAKLLFQQAGVEPIRWNDTGANFSDFMKISRRVASILKQELPEKAVLEERFAKGQRLNPETGEWVRAMPQWQQPVLHVDDIVKMASDHYIKRTKKKDIPKEKIAEWRRNAEEGKRFNPDSKNGSWPSFGSAKLAEDGTLKARTGSLQLRYRAPVLDPMSPTLTDDEKRIWLRFSGIGPTEVGARERFVKNFMQNHQAFDLVDKSFRPLSEREKLLRNVLETNPDFAAAYNRRIADADAKGDFVERLVAGAAAAGRFSGERLKVVVSHDNQKIYVNVIPTVVYQDGKRQVLPVPAEYQKGLLQRYYRYSQTMYVEDDLPPWLK